MRFVRNDDNVAPLREHRVRLPLLGAEFVDQGENIAVILGEQLPQVLAAFRLCTAFGDYPRRREVLVNLAVQFLPVGDHHKGPVARYLTQHFLCEEDHRDALAATLGMPEYPQLALSLPDVGQGLQRVVYTVVL